MPLTPQPSRPAAISPQTLLLPLLLFLLALSAPAQNPILPGDHPDPTIIRIGNTYWTTSTSGDWAPEFPLYHSTDLRHWTPAGAIFPQSPAWAANSFWAPELVSDRGRILVYYVARKPHGPLCVAVATAPQPAGPYTDHGPLLCQPDGSIDPSFARDEHGQPFLIWKEDGNSENKPTPIWAQPLTPDLLHLTGAPTQILVNDPASWEGPVVEGPYIFRHAHRFYLFYAGNACCGSACGYAEGVARADHLLGPWIKDPANPLIPPNTLWKCPGHGTAVQTPKGRDYLIYHAYPAAGTVYLGRESVLDEITWSPDGWPVINAGNGPSGSNTVPSALAYTDDFTTPQLDPEWKWPIHRAPTFHTGNGHLTLDPRPDATPTFIARSPLAATYTATVSLGPTPGASAALALIGDAHSQLAFTLRGDHLELTRTLAGNRQLLWHQTVSTNTPITLRVHSNGHADANFSYTLNGHDWIDAGPAVSLTGLPPWDQGIRIGLVNQSSATLASFSHFSLTEGGN